MLQIWRLFHFCSALPRRPVTSPKGSIQRAVATMVPGGGRPGVPGAVREVWALSPLYTTSTRKRAVHTCEHTHVSTHLHSHNALSTLHAHTSARTYVHVHKHTWVSMRVQVCTRISSSCTCVPAWPARRDTLSLSSASNPTQLFSLQ